jgi:Xaa-Pro dipeptidase
LLEGAIGIEMQFVGAHFLERLRALAPKASWHDVTDAMFDIRAVKEPFETQRLRLTTELLEAGIVAARDRLAPGATAVAVRNTYIDGVLKAVSQDPERYADFSDFWMITSVGSEGKIQVARGAGGIKSGDLIKFDGGTTIGGYTGDGGRTFSYKEPAAPARRLYETLLEAYRIAMVMFRPGIRISDIFHAAHEHMHEHGYPRYRRGQFGHSLGIEDFPEEPPFISATEHRLLEPGMVFALETPYYGSDVGSIMIEDLFAITETGSERLNTLPLELTVVQ